MRVFPPANNLQTVQNNLQMFQNNLQTVQNNSELNRSKICHLQHLDKFQSYYYAVCNLVQNVNCWNVKLIVIFLLVIFSESFPHRFMSILSVSYLENKGNIGTVLWKGTTYIFSDINQLIETRMNYILRLQLYMITQELLHRWYLLGLLLKFHCFEDVTLPDWCSKVAGQLRLKLIHFYEKTTCWNFGIVKNRAVLCMHFICTMPG